MTNMIKIAVKTGTVIALLIGMTMFSLPNCSCSDGFASTARTTSQKTKKKSPDTTISSQKRTTVSDSAIKQETRQLIVYYFMTSYRCHSCIFIEGTTRKALNEYYPNKQKSGRIVFKMINIEEPQNKHFIDEYGLFTKSVVLSDLKNENQTKWKNLDQVWNLIGQEEEFKAYIAKEVKAYLGS